MSTDPGPGAAADRARRLAHAFAALLVLVVGLMTLGALVRAHEAGLACPDWPLCFGEFVPEMDLKVAFEWSHRVLAGGISLAFVGLAVATLRHPGLRAPLRGHLVAVAGILAVQIVLGALTVWQLLASWTVTSHLLTGNAFAISLLFTALRLREVAGIGAARPATGGGLRGLLAVTAACLVLQIALGGLVSSTFAGLACPEWPTCNGGSWFPSWRGSVGLHLVHRSNGYLLVLLVAACAWRARGVPGLAGPTAALAGLVLAQVGVGIANVLLALPVEVTGLHSLLAALIVLTAAGTVRRVWLAAPDPLPRVAAGQLPSAAR